MSAFNYRLAPRRLWGLPLTAALSLFVGASASLTAVVMPTGWSSLFFMMSGVAFAVGACAAYVGDDFVFLRVMIRHFFEKNLAHREAMWK